MSRCLILCGGANSRWQGHRGQQRKHLVEVDGQCLLDRTLAQARASIAPRPLVVINRGDADAYRQRISGACELLEIDPAPAGATEAWKFLSSQAAWNAGGVTVVLLGDVWFSAAAIRAIADASPAEWLAFGRAGASAITGHAHGELFAQRFQHSGRHLAQLQRLDALYRTGVCQRTAGWAHYHLMIGAHPEMQCAGQDFVHIDDFTDDFDTPADYDRWHAARRWWRANHSAEPPLRPPVADYSMRPAPVTRWRLAEQ